MRNLVFLSVMLFAGSFLLVGCGETNSYHHGWRHNASHDGRNG